MLWKVTITVKQNIQIQMCHFNDHTQCELLSGSHQRLSGMCGSYLFVFVFIDLQSQEEVFMLERERERERDTKQFGEQVFTRYCIKTRG